MASTLSDVEFVFKDPIISDVKSDSCVVAWEAKRFDITGYYVEQSWSHDLGWMRCDSRLLRTTSLLVSNLLTTRRYRFRVVAQTRDGSLVYGKASKEIIIGEPPSKPDTPEVYDVSETSCRVSWRPPSRDGGLPVTHYVIYVRERHHRGLRIVSVSGQEFSCRITNLHPGKEYDFSVAGKNAIGTGLYSQPSHYVRTYGLDLLQKHGSLVCLESDSRKQLALKSVSSSLERGIDGVISLIETAAILTDVVRYDCFSKISKELHYHSYQAMVNLKEAFTKIEAMNQEMNRRLEKLVMEQGQKERDLRRSQIELSGIQKEMKVMERNLSHLRDELKRINDDHDRARRAKDRAEKDLDDEETKQAVVGGVGAGLMIVPVFGWIVGGAMVAVSLTALEDRVKAAKSNLESAENMKDQQKERVNSKEDSIKTSRKRISQKDTDISNIERELSKIRGTINSLRSTYYTQAKWSTELRGFSEDIAGASDRAEILHDQLKYFYNLQPILGPLRNLAEHLSSKRHKFLRLDTYQDVGDKLQLLADVDQDIRALGTIDEHQKGLKAVMMTTEGRENQQLVHSINMSVSPLFTSEALAEDNLIFMSANCSWEQFIIPAPVSISILGQLLVIASKKDFPLKDHPPKGGYKKLKHQSSFRACLLQVSNDGRNAFSIANRNMDNLRTYLQLAPVHIQQVVNMLTRATNAEIQHTVHLPIRALGDIAKKCLSNCQEVENAFQGVIDTIQELQEVCVAYKGAQECEKEDKMILKEIIKSDKRAAKENIKNFKDQCEMIDQSTSRAFDEYEKAVKEIPSTGSLLAMRVVSGILSLVGSKKNSTSKTSSKSSMDKSAKTTNQDSSVKRNIQDIEKELVKVAVQLTETFIESGNFVISANKGQNPCAVCQQRLKRIDNIKGKSREENRLKNLVKLGLELCKDIRDAQKAMRNKTKDEVALAQRILEYRDSVEAQCTSITEEHPDEINMKKSPCLSAWEPDTEIQESLVDEALQQQKRKTEAYCQQLRDAQKRQDDLSKRQEEMYENLQESLKQLSTCKAEKLDIDKIIDVLRNGLRTMSDLKEQWWKIMDFFQQIAVTVESSLNTSLRQFVKYANMNQEYSIAGYTGAHLARDLMFQQIAKTLDLVNHVQMIASTYVEISRKYLMPRVDQLPERLASGKGLKKIKELETDCDHVKESIRDLIRQRKRERERVLKRRIGRIEKGINGQMNYLTDATPLRKSQQDSPITQNLLVDDFV